ncbi:MAG: hypothetical protein E6H07_13315 [Bacteroidetes bacterium]|nr:MAG: hypothetical protein E6H07_13315 [Bacteroidota bacterium]
MKGIKAFTVIELIMTLLISGIVITIAFYAFLFVNKQFGHYIARSNQMNEYALFKKALETDLNRSAFLVDSAGILVCKMYANSDVIYFTSDDLIIRYNEIATDSFRIKNTGFTASFVTGTDKIMNGLLVKLVLMGQDIEMKFDKNYSAEELINAEIKVSE